MPRTLISSGSTFEAEIGYSRAVVQGDWVFVSGTTGYDYATMTMPDDVADQARNALATIGRALAGQPRLLLLDEPTEGIQPNIVQQIQDALQLVRTALNVAVLIVEQNLDFAWHFADRYVILQRGRIVREGHTHAHDANSVAHLIHLG